MLAGIGLPLKEKERDGEYDDIEDDRSRGRSALCWNGGERTRRLLVNSILCFRGHLENRRSSRVPTAGAGKMRRANIHGNPLYPWGGWLGGYYRRTIYPETVTANVRAPIRDALLRQ